MVLLHEEEDDYNHEDERINKAQRAGTHWNLKWHVPLVSL